MARNEPRTRLRQFQADLTERLARAKVSHVGSSHLGIGINDERWLVDLTEAGEIVPVPGIVPVPHTLPWFCGLTSVRGNLLSVVDLARYLGGAPTRLDRDSRLLVFGAGLDINAAVLVSRMLGLHATGAWTRTESATEPGALGAAVWTDDQRRDWRELSLATLATDARFLHISAI
ncbi:chemotaxis protein CheW [Derxia lacustris]|uniref:chemotaxis protein CheW n=1 Tax=Derxia lacustris TaxID=764842 RepID=UPI000A176E70|nr:chemotaxis protein CheW [Derxia lacustris]